MKRLNVFFLLAVLFGTLSLSAQKVIPLCDFFSTLTRDRQEMQQRYYYDKDYDLDPYVGSWVGDNGHGVEMRLKIYKIKSYPYASTHMDILALDMKLSKPGVSLPHPDTELIEGKELIPGFMFYKLRQHPLDLHSYRVSFAYNLYEESHSHSSKEYYGDMDLSLDLVECGTVIQVRRRAVCVVGHRRYNLPDYLTREQKDNILWKLRLEGR